MGHVDGLFVVGQGELEEGVGDDGGGGGVTEPEQGVVREHGPQVEQGPDHHRLVSQTRECSDLLEQSS